MYEPKLYTQRLLLRPILFSDFRNLCDGMNNEYIANRIPSGKHLDVLDVVVWFSTADKRGVNWVIETVKERTFAGCICMSYLHKGSELSYWLLPEHRHQGYMHEALETVLNWSKGIEGLYPIIGEIAIDNQSSISALRKLNFDYVGNGKFSVGDGSNEFESVIFQKSLEN